MENLPAQQQTSDQLTESAEKLSEQKNLQDLLTEYEKLLSDTKTKQQLSRLKDEIELRNKIITQGGKIPLSPTKDKDFEVILGAEETLEDQEKFLEILDKISICVNDDFEVHQRAIAIRIVDDVFEAQAGDAKPRMTDVVKKISKNNIVLTDLMILYFASKMFRKRMFDQETKRIITTLRNASSEVTSPHPTLFRRFLGDDLLALESDLYDRLIDQTVVDEASFLKATYPKYTQWLTDQGLGNLATITEKEYESLVHDAGIERRIGNFLQNWEIRNGTPIIIDANIQERRAQYIDDLEHRKQNVMKEYLQLSAQINNTEARQQKIEEKIQQGSTSPQADKVYAFKLKKILQDLHLRVGLASERVSLYSDQIRSVSSAYDSISQTLSREDAVSEVLDIDPEFGTHTTIQYVYEKAESGIGFVMGKLLPDRNTHLWDISEENNSLTKSVLMGGAGVIGAASLAIAGITALTKGMLKGTGIVGGAMRIVKAPLELFSLNPVKGLSSALKEGWGGVIDILKSAVRATSTFTKTALYGAVPAVAILGGKEFFSSDLPEDMAKVIKSTFQEVLESDPVSNFMQTVRPWVGEKIDTLTKLKDEIGGGVSRIIAWLKGAGTDAYGWTRERIKAGVGLCQELNLDADEFQKYVILQESGIKEEFNTWISTEPKLKGLDILSSTLPINASAFNDFLAEYWLEDQSRTYQATALPIKISKLKEVGYITEAQFNVIASKYGTTGPDEITMTPSDALYRQLIESAEQWVRPRDPGAFIRPTT